MSAKPSLGIDYARGQAWARNLSPSVERFIQSNPWPRPRAVWLGESGDGEPVLIHDQTAADFVATDVPMYGLLDDFCSLAREEALDGFLAYAQRWGVLELCRAHWAPSRDDEGAPQTFTWWSDALTIRPGAAGPHTFMCARVTEQRGTDRHRAEPIEAWRRWAQVFDAALGIAACIANGETPPTTQMKMLGIDGLAGAIGNEAALAAFINWLIAFAGVRPSLIGQPPLRLVPFWTYGLFGALVTQLALVIGDSPKGIYWCDFHRGWFPLPNEDRRPRTDRRVSCPACREKKASQRAAEATRDETKRAGTKKLKGSVRHDAS